MAYKESVRAITLEAGQDLSTHQFGFVTVASDGQVDPTGDGALADGILLNTPDTAGQAAEVALPGCVCKVKCGGTVTAGGRVASDANGDAVDPGTGDVLLGRALEGGSSGEVISIIFQPHGTN